MNLEFFSCRAQGNVLYELHFGFDPALIPHTSSRHFLMDPASLYPLSWIESLHFFSACWMFLSVISWHAVGGADC